MSDTLPAIKGSKSYRYTALSWGPPTTRTVGSLRLPVAGKGDPEHPILAFTDGDVRQTQQWCSDKLEHGNFRKALDGLYSRTKKGLPAGADGSQTMGAVFSVAVADTSKYGYSKQSHIHGMGIRIYSRLYTPDEANAVCTFSDLFVLDVAYYRGFTVAVLNADPQKLSFRVLDDY